MTCMNIMTMRGENWVKSQLIISHLPPDHQDDMHILDSSSFLGLAKHGNCA
jgi:hypothetical protein